MTGESKVLHVRIDANTKRLFKRHCALNDVTMAAMIREYIERTIQKTNATIN